LHRGRWEWRGGSAVLTAGVERMLRAVASDLLGARRFRLYAIDVEGTTIAAQVVLAAGDRAAHWLGGFDDEWARFHPGIQTIVSAIEDSFAENDAVFDLGGGGQAYKTGLADDDPQIVTTWLVPKGRGSFVARATLLPRHGRQALATRLPEAQKRRLAALARRVPKPGSR
jgi:CelD/BcsL family acetyltransferase involved in cellulose biosynthesis